MKTINSLLVLIITLPMMFCSGCGIEEPLERVRKTPKPYYKNLPQAYESIRVKQSTSASVLERIKQNPQELESQSESVIASYGEKKKGYSFWITMAAFDEEDFTLTRKYFVTVDEKPWFLGDKGMRQRLDCQMIINEKVLKEAYTSENQKRIEILKTVLENFRNDIGEVRKESTILDTGAMMINQTFERILYVLNASPALAEKLDQDNGLNFDHMTLGPSRIRMTLTGNVVTIKLRIGNLGQVWKQ